MNKCSTNYAYPEIIGIQNKIFLLIILQTSLLTLNIIFITVKKDNIKFKAKIEFKCFINYG